MNTNRLVLLTVIGGLTITGMISLLIVFAVIYTSITEGRAPDVLVNWGGVIIGFFFGQFFGFVQRVFGLDPQRQIPVSSPEAQPQKTNNLSDGGQA